MTKKDNLQSRQLELLGKFIEKKMESVMHNYNERLEKISARLDSSEKRSLLPAPPKPGNSKDAEKRLASLENEVEDLKEKISTGLHDMQREILDEFDKMHGKLQENAKHHDLAAGRTELDMNTIKKSLDFYQKLQHEGKGHGTASPQDIEMLKTKIQWLELEVDRIDMKSIEAKLKDLEKKIQSGSGTSPYIIE